MWQKIKSGVTVAFWLIQIAMLLILLMNLDRLKMVYFETLQQTEQFWKNNYLGNNT